MSSSQVNLQGYLIPLEEIIRATEDFSPKRCIGSGGFGEVYKAQLSEKWHNHKVAVKRMGRDSYQGDNEFYNELDMISRFHHENIISFIGYCDEGKERIIVFEFAINGSLDHHLQDPYKRRRIKWTQRLKICLGAARGLNYLHSGLENATRVIHRDIKSANILLDDNFVAKICDFGLSKVGPINQPNTQLYTKVAGTPFYVDPRYHESNILSKESDIYSLGVVLFEMLSGMLVYLPWSIGDDRPQLLMNFVRRYELDNEDKLIDYEIRDQVDNGSVHLFKEIAYQCVHPNFKDRPQMDTIIEKIDEALNIQENGDALIKCVMGDVGFSHGKPVAAFTIYKCLLHLKYLETERTSVFDRLIHIFNSAIEDRDNTPHMAYWLSNASNLLFLIQNKVDSASASKSLLERMTMGFPSSVSSTHLKEVVQQVECKQLTLHFIQQLTECVKKMYSIIRENMKKKVGSILALCIQSNFVQATFINKGLNEKGKIQRPQTLFILGGYTPNLWHEIVGHLNTLLNTLKINCVPPIIVRKIYAQIFSFINVELFNSLLMHRNCCTFNNGQYVKAGLAELTQWCIQEQEEYIGSAWDELKHTREASELLAEYRYNNWLPSYFEYKYWLVFEHEYNGLPSDDDKFPTLSKEQLKRIRAHFWDMQMETAVKFENSALSSTRAYLVSGEENLEDIRILLDDSMPFSIDDNHDMFASIQVKDFAKIEPATELAKYKAFDFLYK